MSNKIKIMMVEDHPEFREIVELALEKETDLELTSQFGTSERALRTSAVSAARPRSSKRRLTAIESYPFLIGSALAIASGISTSD